MNKHKIEVGREIVFVRRYETKREPVVSTVTRVGRKYFYFGIHGDYKADLDTLKCPDVLDIDIYLSQEEYDRHCRICSKYGRIRDLFQGHKDDRFDESLLDAILDLVKNTKEQHDIFE